MTVGVFLTEGGSFLTLVVTALSVWLCKKNGISFKRGFYCDQESIRLPYKDGTIPSYALVIISSSLPLIIILCETLTLMKKRTCTIATINWSTLKSPCALRTLNLLKWYLVGILITLIVTDSGKIAIGRLRPHFWDVCKPNYTSFNCTDIEGYPVYVDKFKCSGDPKLISDARLSWPSGHSSITAFFSVFLAVYVSSLPFKSILHVVLMLLSLMITVLTGWSRITDNKHHPSDVLSGWIIGSTVAAGIVYLGWDLLCAPRRKQREEQQIQYREVTEQTDTEVNPLA